MFLVFYEKLWEIMEQRKENMNWKRNIRKKQLMMIAVFIVCFFQLYSYFHFLNEEWNETKMIINNNGFINGFYFKIILIIYEIGGGGGGGSGGGGGGSGEENQSFLKSIMNKKLDENYERKEEHQQEHQSMESNPIYFDENGEEIDLSYYPDSTMEIMELWGKLKETKRKGNDIPNIVIILLESFRTDATSMYSH